MMGTWYEYMYRTPGLDDFNTVNVLSSIGVTSVSGLSTPVIAANWTVSFLVKVPAQNCVGLFTQANVTTDSRFIGTSWLPGQANSGERENCF